MALDVRDGGIGISAADQAQFARWGTPATLIPGCADVDAVRPATAGSRLLLNRLCGFDDEDDTPLFMFAGSKFRPNIVAVQHLRDLVAPMQARFPGLAFRIVVVGACSPPTREEPFVALGFVSDALLTLLYQHCSAVLIPLTLGTGASLKTIEAFAAGAPMLGTTMAYRGMEVTPGVDCLLEDDLDRWPALIARLCQDKGAAGELRRAATVVGDGLHYERGFAAYLPLSPELAAQPLRPDRRGAARLRATMALAAAAEQAGLLDEAKALAGRAAALAPGDPALLAYEAQLLLAQGRPADAYAMSADLLRRGGDPSAALRAMAAAARLDGDGARAEGHLLQAARIVAQTADEREAEQRLRAAIWAAFNGGERQWVRHATSEICKVGAAVNADYHYLFASLEEEAGGDAERALSHARLALEGGFDRFWCLRLIGVLCRTLGRDDEAIAAFRDAREAARDEDGRRLGLDGWVTTAWGLHGKGQAAAALAAVEGLLAIAPDLASAAYLRAELLRADPARGADAIAAYERAQALGFERFWCQLHAGGLGVTTGDFQTACDRLAEAGTLAIDANQHGQFQAAAREAMAAAARTRGLDEVQALLDRLPATGPGEALGDLTSAYGWRPDSVDGPAREAAFQAAVSARFHGGQVTAALLYAREGEAQYPDNGFFPYYAAECLNLMGSDLEAAEAAYGRSFSPQIEPFWTTFNRGHVRAKLGRIKEARDDLEVALRAARTAEQRANAKTSLARL